MRVLIYDLETSPHLGYFWDLWRQNIAHSQVKEFSRVLCFAAKWYGEDEVMFHAEWDGGHKKMIRSLWNLFDQADVLVAHNGDKFDKPRTNAEFLKYKMKPPSPSRSVDTLKVAKKSFRMASNRLDAIGQYLSEGRKMDTGGFQLWLDVLAKDPDGQKTMMEYNIQDVHLLESVYKEMLPWIPNHPNPALYEDDHEHRCTSCGSTNLKRQGYAYTLTQKYQRFRCDDCGKWNRGRTTDLSPEKRKTVMTHDASR